MNETSRLVAANRLLDASGGLLEKMRQTLAELTAQGGSMDEHQVATRQLAQLTSRYRAARALATYAEHNPGDDRQGVNLAAAVYAGELWSDLGARLDRGAADFGLTSADWPPPAIDNPRQQLRHCSGEAQYRELGAFALSTDGRAQRWIDGEDADSLQELMASTRRFATREVAPHAQRIHIEDEDVPEAIIRQMGELGFFGISIPGEYGGVGMGNLAMILATEELSAASLGAAGSLITRPEVVAKALIAGGTPAQKRRWLAAIAQGRIMTAVAVTEPDVGSDVANLKCRAVPAQVGGVAGYEITGNKSWCTFAGRADLLAVLARTDPDTAAGHRGLSLLLIEKSPVPGLAINITQTGGGRLSGRADKTLGYRGMHSFSLRFERFFVPADQVVGCEAGLGKGFYYQMEGFAAGRLQTGGRAVGVAQAALQAALRYVRERTQFGKPVADYQSTRYELGRMQVAIEASRQLTHQAARALDNGEPDAELQAAMAKLVACRMAVRVTQQAQLLHGGWGYAQEFPISRLVVDALVLPIFEGVEPILELKVIGRRLLGA